MKYHNIAKLKSTIFHRKNAKLLGRSILIIIMGVTVRLKFKKTDLLQFLIICFLDNGFLNSSLSNSTSIILKIKK